MAQTRNVVAVVLLSLLFVPTASAALSAQYDAWRTGPIQWIMTGAEKNAWKKVTSDDAASRFIDLFWARRDPTPGTPQNEARDEHDGRVRYADEKFAEPRKRGSLTDRGRVWVVLGPPPNRTDVQGRIASSFDSNNAAVTEVTSGRSNPSGGRQLGAREFWIWEHDVASALFGLPRVEVAFVTDPISRRTTRDVFRRDYGAAEAAVLKTQIKGDYTELPEWAPFGGLAPRTRVSVSAPAPVAASIAPAAPSPAIPAVVAPRGASRLTLIRNVSEIDSQLSGDPFATVVTADRFKTTEDLGWVAQYCGQSGQELRVPFMVRITGGPAEKPVDVATPLEEVVPDRIQASPGCYLLRGAIPLESMAAGTYEFHLIVDDPIVQSDSYDLTHGFSIE